MSFPVVDRFATADEQALRKAGFEIMVLAAITKWLAKEANQVLIGWNQSETATQAYPLEGKT